LTQRVDYLAGLGVTWLWLMPFHPSPRRDDGYDITDFYGVDPDLGSLGDFARFVRMARDSGLRVIVDLVANHTSDCHPWFEAARISPDSPFRDWYIWRDEPPDEPSEVVFPGEEDSAWTYDEQAGQYYLHHFRAAQPDLNLANPDLRDEMVKVMGFWLALGVSGFRVDAVPFLLEDREHAYDLLRSMRACMSRRFGEGILLGENNMPPQEQLDYFGPHGDMLNMQFNFVLNQAMHLAFARADPEPLERALEALPDIPPDAAWANWVRNHDELRLDKLSDEEREEVFSVFGQDPDTRIYGRGLRRRLPSMVDGDERRARLAYSLMFSLPGTPILFYGEEIGMAENLEVEGRLAVRPPMQWSAEEHAGFSPPGERELVRPLCGDLREGQRSGPAARPRVTPELDGATHPPPTRVPRDRLGSPQSRAVRGRRLCSPLRLARRHRGSRPQPHGSAGVHHAPTRRFGSRRPASRPAGRRGRQAGRDRRRGVRAPRVRPSLAAHPSGHAARASLKAGHQALRRREA